MVTYGDYIVYEDGKIWSNKTNKYLSGMKNKNGYIQIQFGRNGKKVYWHRFIAELFIPNPDNKKEVNHKNGVKDDNRVENLEWMTHKENAKYNFSHLGVKVSWEGKSVPKKQRDKISKTLKGRVFSDEHRNKISNSLKNYYKRNADL